MLHVDCYSTSSHPSNHRGTVETFALGVELPIAVELYSFRVCACVIIPSTKIIVINKKRVEAGREGCPSLL